jgi:hypothetical protein
MGEMAQGLLEKAKISLKSFSSATAIQTLLQAGQTLIQSQDRQALRDSIATARAEMAAIRDEVGQERFLRESFNTKIYQVALKKYDEALKSLDQGDLAGARDIFLKTYHGLHQESLGRFESYQSDRKFEQLTVGVAIMVASGFVGGLAAGAVMGGGEIAFGSAAWFAGTAVSGTTFWAANMAGQALVLGEIPDYFKYLDRGSENYDPEKFSKEIGKDIVMNYAMMCFIGAGMGMYQAAYSARVFKPKAIEELSRLGIKDLGSKEAKIALQNLVFADKESMALQAKALYHGGAFASEYAAFTTWDAIALNIDTLSHRGEFADNEAWGQFFSTASFADRLIFLACLKTGNALARQVIHPGHKGITPQARAVFNEARQYIQDLKTLLQNPGTAGTTLVAALQDFQLRAQRLIERMKNPRLPKEVWAQLEQAYREVPELQTSLAKTGWSPEQKYELLIRLAKESGGRVEQAYLALPKALEGMKGADWSPEQKYELLIHLVEKSGIRAAETFELLENLLASAPGPKRWAVAQCLLKLHDHLSNYNRREVVVLLKKA